MYVGAFGRIIGHEPSTRKLQFRAFARHVYCILRPTVNILQSEVCPPDENLPFKTNGPIVRAVRTRVKVDMCL